MSDEAGNALSIFQCLLGYRIRTSAFESPPPPPYSPRIEPTTEGAATFRRREQEVEAANFTTPTEKRHKHHKSLVISVKIAQQKEYIINVIAFDIRPRMRIMKNQ